MAPPVFKTGLSLLAGDGRFDSFPSPPLRQRRARTADGAIGAISRINPIYPADIAGSAGCGVESAFAGRVQVDRVLAEPSDHADSRG